MFGMQTTVAFMLAHAMSKVPYTPDICMLEARPWHRIFIPDEIMRRHSRYDLIKEHSAYWGLGYTHDTFVCFRRLTDQTMVAIESKDTAEPGWYNPRGAAKIKGEVHLISSEGIIALDNYKENGVQFERKRVLIECATRPVQFETDPYKDYGSDPRFLLRTGQNAGVVLGAERVDPILMWMYVGIPDYWDKLVDGGFAFKPVDMFRPKKERQWLKKYYQFLRDK